MNSSRLNRFSEFVVLDSRFGAPTVQHVPSGLLVHSRIDPVAEASMIADSFALTGDSDILLLGGGLGYLADEILHRTETSSLYVLEPFPELLRLAEMLRPNSDYIQNSRCQRITITTAVTTQDAVLGLKDRAHTCISNFLPPLAEHCRHPLSGLLQLFRAEKASQSVYSARLAENEQVNRSEFALLQGVFEEFRGDTREKIVCGAGPSLALHREKLVRDRNKLCIIAASGAVPPLLSMGITPDWCIAMETLPSVLKDLNGLPEHSKVIVFEFSHPEIVASRKWNCYAGSLRDGTMLETRGGTSVIPALDLAINLSTAPIYLCGVDLSHKLGTYAVGANRDGSQLMSNDMPKFAAMRIGLESLIFRRKNQIANTKIYHMTTDGVVRLRGTESICVDFNKSYLNHERLAKRAHV